MAGKSSASRAWGGARGRRRHWPRCSRCGSESLSESLSGRGSQRGVCVFTTGERVAGQTQISVGGPYWTCASVCESLNF